MNISKNFKIMSVFALAVVVATASHAHDSVRSEFVTTDQPFVILRASKAGKYPFMFKCYPGINQLDVVYFGTEKKNGIKLIKKEQDLENLIPIRYTLRLADNTAVQVDKKYTGYRESYLGTGLESFFKTVGLYPSAGYKGKVLVDEYKAGLPMKWALCNVQAFKALKKYVIKSFTAANVVVPENKPLLLVEIIDNQNGLDASDYAFLNEYFQVLDPSDLIVKKFFENANKTVNSIADKAKDAFTVGGGVGEAILDSLDSDKKIKGFDGLKIREAFLLLALGGVSAYAFDAMHGTLKRKADNYIWTNILGNAQLPQENFRDDRERMRAEVSNWYSGVLGKYAAIGLGSVAGIYLAYKIIESMNPEEDVDTQLVQEVEKTQAA